jgi:hypothetical protein
MVLLHRHDDLRACLSGHAHNHWDRIPRHLGGDHSVSDACRVALSTATGEWSQNTCAW